MRRDRSEDALIHGLRRYIPITTGLHFNSVAHGNSIEGTALRLIWMIARPHRVLTAADNRSAALGYSQALALGFLEAIPYSFGEVKGTELGDH